MSEVQSITSSGNVREAITRAATRSGVDLDYLLAQARIESNLDPRARAATSSASGLYQFTQGTWLRTLEAHGAEHGLGWASAAIDGGRVRDPAMRAQVMALRFDPDASAAMAAMNAAKPLDFSSFPSVLLFATPLRLALNVASTRVVLVHGHEGTAAAGHVIEAFGCEALWINAAQRDQATAQGFLTVDAGTVIATHLNQLLAARPQDLLGPDEVRTMVDGVKQRAAGLVETVHPQPLGLAALTRLLRADLGSLIVGRICAPGERLPVVTLDAALEGMIVQPRARRALAALLRLRAPSCLVLSISELPQSQPIEVIEVVGGEPQAFATLPGPIDNPSDNFPTESLAA